MRQKLLIMALVCLLALAACKGAPPEAPASPDQNAPATSASPSEPEASGDSAPPEVAVIDNSETGVGVIIQDYLDDGIAEILMITYDGQQKAFEEYGGKNPEIELLNTMIRSGPMQIYQSFPDGVDASYIEIRSYPFVDEDFVQIVTSCIVYPETDPELYTKLWSYNFNKTSNEIITVDDMLAEYNMTREDIAVRFEELYVSHPDDETIVSIEITGFLINRVPAKPVTHFLIEVMLELHSDPYKCFFMYMPDLGDMYETESPDDELTELNNECLFDRDVYDMVAMDPPLAYERWDSGEADAVEGGG